MTNNEQIIIHDVDVNECRAFYVNASHPERKECINPFCKNYCKDNPNCSYKQLKRKEQECELWNCANIELSSDVKKYREALEKIDEFLELLNDRTMVRKDICDRLDEMQNIIVEVFNE